MRRYASTDAPKSGSGNGLLYTGGALAAISGGYFYMRRSTPTGQAGNAPPSEEAKKIPAVSDKAAKSAFTGGDQGFLSLKLDKSEVINHNTKKLTFLLPEEDMESGLHVACTSARIVPCQGLRYCKSQVDKLLIRCSCRHYQVQGPRDAEARHKTIHTDERR